MKALARFAAVVGMVLMASCSSADVSRSSPRSLEERLTYSGERAEANFALVEQLTKACMAERGFEYNERRLDAVDFRPVPTIGNIDIEIARQVGFGVTSSLLGSFDENSVLDGNAELSSSLSAAEYDAWFLALRGDGEDPMSGCRNLAKSEANGQWFSQVEPIQREYAQMWHRFNSDPEIVELDRRWAACFAERGFGNFANFRSLVDSFGPIVLALNPSDSDAVSAAEADEVAKASAAAECAAPLQGEWLVVWDEYEGDFLAGVQLPVLPGI